MRDGKPELFNILSLSCKTECAGSYKLYNFTDEECDGLCPGTYRLTPFCSGVGVRQVGDTPAVCLKRDAWINIYAVDQNGHAPGAITTRNITDGKYAKDKHADLIAKFAETIARSDELSLKVSCREEQACYSGDTTLVYRHPFAVGKTNFYVLHNVSKEKRIPTMKGTLTNMVRVPQLDNLDKQKPLNPDEYRLVTALHPTGDANTWVKGDLTVAASLAK